MRAARANPAVAVIQNHPPFSHAESVGYGIRSGQTCIHTQICIYTPKMLETATSSTSSQERWDLYRTLAEPLRLRLLALVGEEELAVGELAELLKESQPNVSRAWTPLRD